MLRNNCSCCTIYQKQLQLHQCLVHIFSHWLIFVWCQWILEDSSYILLSIDQLQDAPFTLLVEMRLHHIHHNWMLNVWCTVAQGQGQVIKMSRFIAILLFCMATCCHFKQARVQYDDTHRCNTEVVFL